MAGVLFLALAVGGCATPQTDALRRAPPASLPATAQLSAVPFFAQREFQCGPATLAMALHASGRPATPDELTPQVFLPAREGSLQAEMLAVARRYERLAVVLPPRLDAALAEVAAGRPVIVLLNLALPIAPVWHYALLVGFDRRRGHVVLNSGESERLTLPFTVFERTWARSGYWAMVAVDPRQLPESPDEMQLLHAAAALERVSSPAARHVYASLTRRAPSLYGAWMGLGNTAYAAGDYAAAAGAFEQGTRLTSEPADVLNNLALARLRLGDMAGAREAAARAVQSGGPRTDRYRETMRQVESAVPR